MKNFPIKDPDGKEWWISRANVCSGYVFAKNIHGEWCVLAAQRGIGSTNPHKLNVPGGYLDFDEYLTEGCAREVYEETGIHLPARAYHLFNIDDRPRYNSLQNVIYSFWAVITDRTTNILELSDRLNEPNETENLMWLKVESLKHDSFSYCNPNNWLRNHYDRIMYVYDNFVNPSIRTRIKRLFIKDSIYI